MTKKADADQLDLVYFDGSGFNLWAKVVYAWQKRGERIIVPVTRGKSQNVLGFLWHRGQKFESFVFGGSIDASVVITCFDDQQPGYLDFLYRIRALAKVYQVTVVSQQAVQRILAMERHVACREYMQLHPEAVWRHPATRDHFVVDLDTEADLQMLVQRTGLRVERPA